MITLLTLSRGSWRRSTRRFVFAVVAGTFLATAAAGAQAGANPPTETAATSCGFLGFSGEQGDFFGRITARNLSCANAKRLLRRWHASGQPGNGPRGYRCNQTFASSDGVPTGTTRCRRRDRRLSWVVTV